MIAIAVLATIASVWAFLTLLHWIESSDFFTAVLAGFFEMILLAIAAAIIYGLYLVWVWAT